MAEKEALNPLWLAVLALLIPQFIAIYQEHNKFKIERAQYESNLILRAIDPNDRKKTLDAVRFLVRAGFISEDKILNVLKDSTLRIPTISEATPSPAPVPAHTIDERLTFSGVVVDAVTGRPLFGATVSASSGNMKEEMITAKDGRFVLHYPTLVGDNRIRRNRPSSWVFMIKRPGYMMHNVWEPGFAQFAPNTVFALSPVEHETIGDKIFK